MSSRPLFARRLRWRFFAATLADTFWQFRVVGRGAFFSGLTRLGRRPRRSARQRAELFNPKPFPRTAALTTAFSRSLKPVLPEGLVLTGGPGRGLHFRDSSRAVGSIGVPVTADMPDVMPSELARVLRSTMKTLTKVLTDIYGAELQRTLPPGTFQAQAEGNVIRTWWQLADGTVTARLADIPLLEVLP